jgi:hypothetical protein
LKALFVVFFFIVLVTAWLIFFRGSSVREMEEARAHARAYSFVIYRNAVNNHVLAVKMPVDVPLDALSLPVGLAAPDAWSNRTVVEDDEMHCYVWGPATPTEIKAVRDLLLGSRAVGWNDNGNLARAGAGWPLPAFIPDRSVVSVISVH